MIEPGSVLAWARSQDYAPAQNVRDTPMGGLEFLLVPDLDAVERVVWVGRPSPGDRAMLRAALPHASLTEIGAGHGHVVVVTDARVRRRLVSDRRAASTLAASVDPDGTLLVHTGLRDARRVADALARARPGVPTATLRGFPLRGPLRAILPAGDATGYRILARHGLLRPSAGEGELRGLVARGAGPRPGRGRPRWQGRALQVARGAVRRVTRLLAAAERRAGAGERLGRAIVVQGPDAGRPAAYLRRLAESPVPEAWGLAAPGAYPSQKVLWALRGPGDEDTGMLAKMTRDPRFSPRLAHAHEILSTVAALPLPVGSGVPQPRFAGRAGGLAIAAEAAVGGMPMGTGPTLGAGTPAVRRTIDWFAALAERSRQESSGSAVADALDELRERLEAAATLAPEVVAALRASASRLRQLPDPVPLVLQHGDPGVNNVLVRPDGGITVLDWENGERNGMPLWDLLYFVRSVAVASGTAGGTGRLEASLAPFTEDGPLADLLLGAVQEAPRRIGLQEAAVEPLVLHCWVQQALKETTRLPAGAADASIFLRFLHELVARQDRPTWRRLVAGDGS